MREGPLQHRLARAGCLADQHHIANNCAAGNWRGLHARTAATTEQLRDVPLQRALNPWRGNPFQNRRKIDSSKLSTMLIMMQVTMGK
jgi:hypothetical protein